MPMYLKKDSIRFLESSIETISMAITSLGSPERIDLRNNLAKNSVTIGMTGISAELAMSAILTQANGKKSLLLPSGYYKSASNILEDFKKLIKERNLKISFLIKDVDDMEKMLNDILNKLSKFKLLMPLRASGVHAGIGVSKDVCIVAINNVIDFLSLISKSSRIKPYTFSIPKKIEIIKENQILIDELIEKLKKSNDIVEKANAIASIYLVAPELPEHSEIWMDSFEKLMISPKADDISFLLDTLKDSKYASLIKVSKNELGLPVVVEKDNPLSLPIEPQFLKKSFTSIKDRFYADTRVSNGRLEESILDVPPIDSIYEIFTFKFEKLGIKSDKNGLISHNETWSLICSSLTYAGTIGPIWYFIRKTDNINQLKAYLKKALNTADTKLNKNFKKIKDSFDAVFSEGEIESTEEYVKNIIEMKEIADKRRENLEILIEKQKGTPKELKGIAMEDFNKFEDEEITLGDLIINIIDDKYKFDNNEKIYWAKNFCESATEEDDLEGILAIIKTKEMKSIHTVARKAIQMIDFVNYGPSVKMDI